MLKIIANSLISPVKYYPTTLFLIFPALLITVVIGQDLSHFSERLSSPNATYTANAIAAYFGLICISGFIGLHKKIILNEKKYFPKLIPSQVVFNYAIFTVILVALLAMSIPSAVNFILEYSGLAGKILEQPGSALFIKVLIAFIVLGIAVLQVLIRMLFILPRIAIERESQQWNDDAFFNTLLIAPPVIAVVFVVMLSSLPLVTLEFAGGYLQKQPVMADLKSYAIVGVTGIAALYACLVAITSISLVYRDYILAAMEKPVEHVGPWQKRAG